MFGTLFHIKHKTMISKYLSLVKFSHTLFAMPFALIGFFMAVRSGTYPFEWLTLLLVVLCMVFARNSAMGFNRYIDRQIDKKNPRTAIREIPSGKINAKNARIFVIINSFLFITATWFINPMVFALSPIALLVVLGYSYTKRFTSLCHFVLGVGLALAPIGAYLAVTAQFAVLPLLISFAVLFWVSGFDIIYALQDTDFDQSLDLYSIPVLLGAKRALNLSIVLHLLTALLLLAAGVFGNFNIIYWIGFGVFSFALAYQHLLVKPNDLSKVNAAFFTTNGIASVLFAIFTIGSFYF